MLPVPRKSPVTVKKEEEKKPHVKKPLNAFMLYMKEMRAKVVAECTLKESAAINQILGRKVRSALALRAVWATCPAFTAPCPLRSSPPQWHNLSREEQAKYYELARKERQLHSQLYPTWSARDNYVRAHPDPRSSTGTRKEGREIVSVDGGLLRLGRSPCFYRNAEGISVLSRSTRTWF